MNTEKINFKTKIQSIKAQISLPDYVHNTLGMHVYPGQRCAASYRGGENPSSFALYDENIPWGLHTLEPAHRALFPTEITASNGQKIIFGDYLCILEGGFDAMSFEQNGFQCISPFGGHFAKNEIPFVLDIAKRAKKVFVCFDNDEKGISFQIAISKLFFQHKIPFVINIVPKKLKGACGYNTGSVNIDEGSCDVIGLDTQWDKSKIHPGDIFTIDDVNLYTIKEVKGSSHIVLNEPNKQGNVRFSGYSITTALKDVSDYYCAGGNLADFIAEAEDGAVALARSFGQDVKALKEFLHDCTFSHDKLELQQFVANCKDISPQILNNIIRGVTRPLSDDDISRRILGFVDNKGMYHEGKHDLVYIVGDGFYEYQKGFWTYRDDEDIERYIRLEFEAHIPSRNFYTSLSGRITSALKLLKIDAKADVIFNRQAVMNFKNGILDLSRNDENVHELLAHHRKYYSTLQVPYNYDPDAKCPKWIAFLRDVLGGDECEEKIRLLQQFAGYVLFTDMPVHKMLMLMGDGRNGKGTVLEILREVFGGECVTTVNPAHLNKEFEAILIKNSYLNICFDASKDFRPAQEELKMAVAGETLMGCHKFQKHVQFTPRAKWMIAANNLVKICDLTRGFMSRVKFVYFNHCYEGRENFNLQNELKSELAGIFNWVLEGYLELRRNLNDKKGFIETNEEKVAMSMFEEVTSPVFAFYNEYSNPANIDAYGNSDYFSGIISTSEMFEKYCRWCEIAKYPNKNRGSFTREFKAVLKQKCPWMFERYGLNLTFKGQDGRDYYDFNCENSDEIKHSPKNLDEINAGVVEREKNNFDEGEAGVVPPAEYPANPDNSRDFLPEVDIDYYHPKAYSWANEDYFYDTGDKLFTHETLDETDYVQVVNKIMNILDIVNSESSQVEQQEAAYWTKIIHDKTSGTPDEKIRRVLKFHFEAQRKKKINSNNQHQGQSEQVEQTAKKEISHSQQQDISCLHDEKVALVKSLLTLPECDRSPQNGAAVDFWRKLITLMDKKYPDNHEGNIIKAVNLYWDRCPCLREKGRWGSEWSERYLINPEDLEI